MKKRRSYLAVADSNHAEAIPFIERAEAGKKDSFFVILTIKFLLSIKHHLATNASSS
jgi:hypothetical protein